MTKCETMRALAHNWNRLADAAYENVAAMRAFGCSESMVGEAELASGRARGVAARLDELAAHLEGTR